MRPQYGAFFTEKEVKRRKMYDTTEKFNAIKDSPDVLILGIESSCDETAAAVVRNGREVLSNVIASQIEIHRRYGGVVPEVASRNHTMAVNNVISEALGKAGVTLDKIDAIAVTYGAGLVGALLVGGNGGKIAFLRKRDSAYQSRSYRGSYRGELRRFSRPRTAFSRRRRKRRTHAYHRRYRLQRI